MASMADNQPLYLNVQDELRERIERGYYGDQLPPLRVLSGDFNISESTTKKIIDQLKRQKYLYGKQGKGVFVNKRREEERNRKIAVFFPKEKKGNPFYERGVKYLQEIVLVDDANGILILDTVDKVREEADAIKTLILLEVNNLSVLEQLAACVAMEKIIQLNSRLSDDATSICSDNFRGGYLAMEYLHGKGHRRIGVIASDYDHPTDYSIFAKRLAGAHAFCEKAKLPLPPPAYAASRHDGYMAAAGLLSAMKLTALYCFTDTIASGVYDFCAERKIEIPQDLSILGFNNLPLAAQLRPPLTTYEENLRGIIDALTEACSVNPSNALCTRHLQLDPSLIERDSVMTLAMESVP